MQIPQGAAGAVTRICIICPIRQYFSFIAKTTRLAVVLMLALWTQSWGREKEKVEHLDTRTVRQTDFCCLSTNHKAGMRRSYHRTIYGTSCQRSQIELSQVHNCHYAFRHAKRIRKRHKCWHCGKELLQKFKSIAACTTYLEQGQQEVALQRPLVHLQVRFNTLHMCSSLLQATTWILLFCSDAQSKEQNRDSHD